MNSRDILLVGLLVLGLTSCSKPSAKKTADQPKGAGTEKGTTAEPSKAVGAEKATESVKAVEEPNKAQPAGPKPTEFKVDEFNAGKYTGKRLCLQGTVIDQTGLEPPDMVCVKVAEVEGMPVIIQRKAENAKAGSLPKPGAAIVLECVMKAGVITRQASPGIPPAVFLSSEDWKILTINGQEPWRGEIKRQMAPITP